LASDSIVFKEFPEPFGRACETGVAFEGLFDHPSINGLVETDISGAQNILCSLSMTSGCQWTLLLCFVPVLSNVDDNRDLVVESSDDLHVSVRLSSGCKEPSWAMASFPASASVDG
jgi:hypothetical protein